MAGGALRWIGVIFNALKTTGLGLLAERSLGGGILMMDVHDSAIVWCRGSIDDMVNMMIPVSTMDRWKTMVAAYGVCTMVCGEGLLDQIVLPAHRWTAWLTTTWWGVGV